ncbi:MAG: FecR family protein [Endomicrobia bacterium]|nr:FecR family protein [Endomicrobiia bacterium]
MKIGKIVAIKVLTLLYLSTYCFLSEGESTSVVLSSYKGKVEILVEGKKLSIKKGMLLKEDYIIRTGKDSMAVLIFQDGSNIVLGANSEISLRRLTNNDTTLDLKNGRLKAEVTPRQPGQNFEVRTPVSVASVRGTKFMLSFENGISDLIVIEGNVLFSDNLGNTTEVNENESCNVTDAGLGQKSGVDKDKLNELLKEFEHKEEVFEEKDIRNIDRLKDELRDFINDVKMEKYYLLETVQQVKDADFETGRTLRDIHGNLTRVEQVISRNKDNAVEFINITKRDMYKYKGYYSNYASEVASNKPRIDILKLGIEFNQALPEKISEWPGFIAEKNKNDSLDFYPTRVYCEFTHKASNNLNDSFLQEVKFNKIYENGKWKLDGEGKIQISNGNETYEVDTDYDEEVKGKLPEGKSKDEDDGKLWGWAEGPLPVKKDINGDGIVNNKDILWLQSEVYLINNNGEILSPSYFISGGSKDPFTMLKEIAFESIVFVRKPDGQFSGPGANFFNKNIDLVITPDIIVALVKQIAPSLGNLDIETEN